MTPDWDALEAENRCECGVLLADHPPLPAPGPLHERTTLRQLTWKGEPLRVSIAPETRARQNRDAQRRHRALGIRG
jgi:hypothetical protein